MRPSQFSLRTLFVLMTGMAFVLGYWVSLPSVLPRWKSLLSRIEASQVEFARDGWLMGRAAIFRDWNKDLPPPYCAFMALLSFYGIKLCISRRVSSVDLQWLAFLVLLCPTLTYIYLYWTNWGDWLVYYPGHWFIDPLGLLTVPVATFSYDALRNAMPPIKGHVLRSACEIFIVTPIWYFLCVLMALVLGWAWI